MFNNAYYPRGIRFAWVHRFRDLKSRVRKTKIVQASLCHLVITTFCAWMATATACGGAGSEQSSALNIHDPDVGPSHVSRVKY